MHKKMYYRYLNFHKKVTKITVLFEKKHNYTYEVAYILDSEKSEEEYIGLTMFFFSIFKVNAFDQKECSDLNIKEGF